MLQNKVFKAAKMAKFAAGSAKACYVQLAPADRTAP